MMAPLLTLLSVAAAGLAEDEAISSALDTEDALSDDSEADSRELLGEAEEVALALLRVTLDMRVDVGLDVLLVEEEEEEEEVVEAALLVLVDSASS